LTQYKFKSDITFYCPKDGSGIVLFDLKSHKTSYLSNVSEQINQLITLECFTSLQAAKLLNCDNIIADEIIRNLSFQNFIYSVKKETNNVC